MIESGALSKSHQGIMAHSASNLGQLLINAAVIGQVKLIQNHLSAHATYQDLAA